MRNSISSNFASRYPVGRFRRPKDVAKAVAYLVENDWDAGGVLEVDGGYGSF